MAISDVNRYLMRVLPSLPAYPVQSRDRVRQQVTTALQAFPALKYELTRFGPEGKGPPNSGTTTLLELIGTVNINYRGGSYNIPVSIRLPVNFPHRPPMCYVREVGNIRIKLGHPQVDQTGMCMNLQSLMTWSIKSQYSTLVVVLTELQDVFTAMPPVYSAANTSNSGAQMYQQHQQHQQPANPAFPSNTPQSRLPPGWEMKRDPSGRAYYVDHNTRTSQWNPPPAPTPVMAKQSSLPSTSSNHSLPPGWEARRDAQGRTYYIDHNTKSTSWNPPPVAHQQNQIQQPPVHHSSSYPSLAGPAPSVEQADAPSQDLLAGFQAISMEAQETEEEKRRKHEAEEKAAKEREKRDKALVEITGQIEQLEEAQDKLETDDLRMENEVYDMEKELENGSLSLEDYLKKIRSSSREQFQTRHMTMMVSEELESKRDDLHKLTSPSNSQNNVATPAEASAYPVIATDGAGQPSHNAAYPGIWHS